MIFNLINFVKCGTECLYLFYSKAAKEEDDDYAKSNINYYNMAHSKTEKVTAQASIMVNGKLKAYQVCTSLSLLLIVIFIGFL